MAATLNNRNLNDPSNHVHIVMEAGPTHYGLESAKELAKAAKEGNADSVKFQMIDAARLIADKTSQHEYSYLEIDDKGNEHYIPISESEYEVLKRRELSKREWKELKAYCDEIGIHMFTTATYKDEVDFIVDELGIDSIKICSGDVDELDFIEYCAKKGVNLQFDTGNSDLWEIEKAVITAEEAGCEDIIIHLCPSGYPARLESIHLNMLTTLRNMFPNYGIAFSDHSPGGFIDIAAVALQADMLEKTITLDRTIKSTEHSFSLEPQDIPGFINTIREVEVALGNSRRTIPTSEKKKRKSKRRSPYALKNVAKGTEIKREDFEFKRPGYGITSEEFNFFIGKKLATDIEEHMPLSYNHI